MNNRPGSIFTAWFIFCLICLFVLMGTLTYVAVHFLGKVW